LKNQWGRLELKFERVEDRLRIEVTKDEDLWYLSLILSSGDIIFSDVFRRTEDKGDKIRSKKTSRERIRVGIRMESLEFLEFNGQLHVLGKIVSGPEDYLDSYQSINIQKDSQIEVIPKNPEFFIKNLEEFLEFAQESFLLLSVDDEAIKLYKISENDNLLLFEIDRHIGKQYEAQDTKWLDELKRKLKNYSDKEIFLIGPSLFKDQLMRELKEFKIANTNISESDEQGIRELLQSGLTKLRKSFENELVANFLKKIANETGLYGIDKIKEALDMRSVEILLMTDKYFRENAGSEIFQKCYSGGCKIFVLHSSWETGKIIQSFGGIAAILRYKI